VFTQLRVRLQVPSGPQGAQVVKQLLEQWPALKPLALVLKVRSSLGLGSLNSPSGLPVVHLGCVHFALETRTVTD
jgi:hypothetical protein